MNILLANLTYLPHIGGIENSFRHISAIYKNQGHNVVVVCSNLVSDKKGKLDSFEIINGIEVHRYNHYEPKFKFLKPFVIAADIINSWLLVNKLDKTYKFDFSIVRNMRVGLGVRFALKTSPVIYVIPAISKYQDDKSINCFSGNALVRLIKWVIHRKIILALNYFFEKMLIRKSDYNVVFSQNMMTQVNHIVNIDDNRIRLIRPGVDSERFKPKKNNLCLNEEHIETNSNNFNFLILCRLISIKGIDRAIEAIKLLNSSNKHQPLNIQYDCEKVDFLRKMDET